MPQQSRTPIETKLQMLLEIFQLETPTITESDIEMIVELFQDLGSATTVREMMLHKCPVPVLIQLFDRLVVSDAEMVTCLTSPTYPDSKISECLREVDYDSRRFFIDQLMTVDPVRADKIIRQLDVGYDMIEGIIVQDLSKKAAGLEFKTRLSEMIDDPNCQMDEFKELLRVAIEQDVFQDWAVEKMQSYKDVVLSEDPVNDRDEFGLCLKLVWIATVSTQGAELGGEAECLKRRIGKSLLMFQSEDAVCTILNQCPELVINEILEDIDRGCRIKDATTQKYFRQLKKEIETGCQNGKGPIISRCVKRYGLEYNISKPQQRS